MKIIISPAKKMISDFDTMDVQDAPVFLDRADVLRRYLKALPYEELKRLLACNDAIAQLNYERYQHMNLRTQTSPAILSYDGIQYTYMAPQVFEDCYFTYIQKHLRIISGFYGILKPFDGIVPYRLEMQAKLKTPFCKNLYDFWGDSIYRELARDTRVILNLASREYSKTVEKYLSPSIRYITCTFGEWSDGKVVEKGVYVKMARGELVRYMAEHQIEDAEQVKAFDRLGYRYTDALSSGTQFVFIKGA
ncbi:MAG TPA: peroxide stress protein YaaA [Candidatus Avimonoglobus intestinipullorum]|uniref:UPF0246 protein IAB04_08495 n=1 Tax=Candidatus Avimonoglobus intestinipullorum TaxID=2840699 RepID=A0A9D1LWK3_9FIRM|nr:peroxide stress protein YaaA [Candidatus Avimonoglobus intestinipullorum]